MINFENFMHKEVKRITGLNTISLTTLSLFANMGTNLRTKEIVSHFLFFKSYKKSSELTKDLEDKYSTWDNLEKEYRRSDNKQSRDFKTIRNYDLYKNHVAMKQQIVLKAYKLSKEIKTTKLAKTIGVSNNVASAFKRGDLKRISADKVVKSFKDIESISKNK